MAGQPTIRRVASWIWEHAVGLAAVACFAAMTAYMARQVRFTPVPPPKLVVVATEPTKVEVKAALPEETAQPGR